MEEEYLGVFLYNRSDRSTTCAMCNSNFKGFNKFNLKRHYGICVAKHHGNIECGESIAKKLHHITLSATTREIILSYLKIVTIHGKPFTVLKSLQDIFEPVRFLTFQSQRFIQF